MPEESSQNFDTFRDCLSSILVEKASSKQAAKPRRRSKAAAPETAPSETDDSNGLDELAEFIDYIATEAFPAVPVELQTLNHYIWAETPSLQERYSLPLTGADIDDILPALDASVRESLETYGITDESRQGINEFLAPVLSAYITAVSTPPPPPGSTKGQVTACEICGRDWINLTYHHLIPRFVHDKVIKRGWHRPEELNNVAWLCGACHRFVHRFASHEDLARNYYTVELLLQQEEVVSFATWVSRLRWKGK